MAADEQLGINFKELIKRGRHSVHISVGGTVRDFIFYTPFNSGEQETEPIGLVFFYHGMGSSAEQASKLYGWMEKADAENFFLVFPQAFPVRSGEEGSFLRNPTMWRVDKEKGDGVDDFAFFETMLNQLPTGLPINTNRIYISGFSNGGGMAFALGARYSDRIAAIGPVATDSPRTSAPLRPLSVVYMTGTNDPLNPMDGGPVHIPWGGKMTITKRSVQETINEWAEWDDCPREGMLLTDIDGVQKTLYGPGKYGVQILVYTIADMGHHWPGTKEPLPKSMSGPVRDPFHATDLIWDFFVYHPLITKTK